MSVPSDRVHMLHLLHEMLRVRRLEEKAAELYTQQKIRGFLHLYVGEEAIAVGAIEALDDEDAIVATYREHGHGLLRGVTMSAILAEMYGKSTGCSRGRGGSMHFFCTEKCFFGGHAIVGAGLPVAVGIALADKMQGRRRVTACFFGDGATDEGAFHESLNLAALWRLPVLFLCENNQYAMGTAIARHQSNIDLSAKPPTYGIPAEKVDGMDVLAVERAVRYEAESVRESGTPRFIELSTYRFRAHSMFDAELYRQKAEVAQWKKRDPIALLIARGKDQGLFDDGDVASIEREVASELEAAVRDAEEAPIEPVEALLRDVVAREVPSHAPRATQDADLRSGSIRRATYREAVRGAMRKAMLADPRVFLTGEDVGRYGGAFAVSMGLLEELGPERIRDTPLSEGAFVGAGIGAAIAGMRPIVEIMTVNFSLLAMDQIVNNAATLHHMSGGQLSVPLLIRMTTGGGKQLAAQHSHSFENWYASVPGLKVLAAGTVQDARDMVLAGLDDPDPVILFETMVLYNMEGDLDDDAPFDGVWHAAVRRSGTDVSLITYGSSVPKTLEAAEALAAEGVSAEVLDLRCLRPLDQEAIVGTVRRTHRAVIVDEAWRSGSLAAEVCARIVEGAFYELDAPIERVCTAEVPIPYAKHLEDAALPSVDAIIQAARRTLARA